MITLVVTLVALLAVVAGDARAPASAQTMRRSEAAPPADSPRVRQAPTPPSTSPVNINRADAKELMTLEGIGKKVAERIIAYRDEHGPFKKPEEVRKVDGVGAGLWEKNRARITVK